MNRDFPDTLEAPENSPTGIRGPHTSLIGRSIDQLTAQMDQGTFTSVELVESYIERIAALDADGPRLNSVLEVNPDARAIAAERDAERARGDIRGPLHGVPVLLKDNIDTADSMHTTAGSLALMDSTPSRDATVVTRLRDAGAVILGKTNLSEWANFRGTGSSSSWSARGGLAKHPYALTRNPSGSSSGSAVAVAASLAPVAIGTETNGSIVSPASACGVVGVKPTVGLTSRRGVIPISHSQDSVGVFGVSVADTALVLTAIAGVDVRDPATTAGKHLAGTDFRAMLDIDALRGARLGVPVNIGTTGYSRSADTIFEAAIGVLESLGATVVRDIQVPSADELGERPGEFQRLVNEFLVDINAYLAERGDPAFKTLADLIAFNTDHADEELRWFGQELFEMAQNTANEDETAKAELDARLRRLSRQEGLDATLKAHDLDALIAPTRAPASQTDLVNGEKHVGGASTLPAIAGYPIITVPAGFAYGLPVGLSFMGTAWSDARLLSLAYAWEQATRMYREPAYREDDIAADPATPQYELPRSCNQ